MTALEIAIKYRLGKLPEAAGLIADFETSLLHYGFEELRLSAAHALRTVGSDHADPFDRVLAAQALELRIPLVTRDPAFEQFDELSTLW
jgi:PIN domain nuclease of toxin-antitoxin system